MDRLSSPILDEESPPSDLDDQLLRLRQSVARTWQKRTGKRLFQTLNIFLLSLSAVLLLYYFRNHTCENCASSYFVQRRTEKNLDPRQQFVYVYDLGIEWTDEILEKIPAWYSVQYDGEKILNELLVSSNEYRTTDPEKATLFYVPFYGAYFTLLQYRDAEVNMKEAVEETSKMWDKLLTRIRTEFPYFNRSRGKDHFSILTMDHGRCTALTFLNTKMYGEMFFLQLNGDKMVRSNHGSTNRSMQALTYNYGVPPDPSLPDIPCYMADRDIVIPPLVRMEPSNPLTTVKTITALFRFSEGQHHGVPIPHHGHLLRKELYHLWQHRNIPGWDFGVKSEEETNEEWSRSQFCIAPPGHSQWTSRPSKSILSGCIPVTFYREHDSPWQDEINYADISINIDPDELHTLRAQLENVLITPGKLEKMQKAITRVQDHFRWSGNFREGVEFHVLKRLKKRAEELKFMRQNRDSL